MNSDDPIQSVSRLLPFAVDCGIEELHHGVVPQWYDGVHMRPADLSQGIAGRKVIALGGEVFDYKASLSGGLLSRNRVPGFLFCGDDGDSLRFWSQPEGPVFQFEPSASVLLWRTLGTPIANLVSQGAAVFCYRTGETGHQVTLEFPERDQLAA